MIETIPGLVQESELFLASIVSEDFPSESGEEQREEQLEQNHEQETDQPKAKKEKRQSIEPVKAEAPVKFQDFEFDDIEEESGPE